MTLSIDISNNQDAVDIAAVKKAHPDLSIVGIKATEGRSFVDSWFDQHFKAAEAAGVIVVPYHFARPDVDKGLVGGVAEADFFLNDVWKYKDRACFGVPALDYESAPDVLFAEAFAKRVQQKLGVRPLVYVSGSRVPELYASLFLRSCHLWIAAYGASYSQYVPKGWPAAMWQYTDRLSASFPYDASQVFVHPDTLRVNKPELRYVLDGKLHTVKSGDGRIKHFLHVKLGKMLAAGKVITRLRRVK